MSLKRQIKKFRTYMESECSFHRLKIVMDQVNQENVFVTS